MRRAGGGVVTAYVVEQYMPAADSGSLDVAVRRLRLAAAELTREGRPIRYVQSIVIPVDDTCFHVFEGSSADDVREASQRAALRYDRIVEALQAGRAPSGRWRTSRLRDAAEIGGGAMKATLALAALATAALALAPAALADRPDDRGGMIGVGAAQTAATSARPDDRAVARGPGAWAAWASEQTSVRPDDRAGLRGPGPAPVVVTQAEPGFDWGAAGIGALGAFGICLTVVAGLQLAARGRRRQAPA